MIRGKIGLQGEVFFPLEVQDRHGDYHSITVLVDTGFTGYLTLTPELIDALGLPFDKETAVIVGDGTTQYFRQFAGHVQFSERSFPVQIYSVSGIPVVGLQLLHGGELKVVFVQKGDVEFQWHAGSTEE